MTNLEKANQQQERTMNLVIPKPASAIVLPEDDDPYGEIAMEGGGQFGRILKYRKGEWLQGETTISLGTEFVALIPEAMRGDVRFQDGRPVDQRIGLIRERAKFARRADLGFTDESVWERDKKGNKIDPWSPQNYLPMVCRESGDLYCYIFRSAGAKQTFRDLCRAYSLYRKTTMLPVVSLQTDRYNHPDYSWIDIPILKIEHWEESSNPLAETPNPDGGAAGAGARVIGEGKAKDANGLDRDDMDDGIPF
jgi:hypothetical protein